MHKQQRTLVAAVVIIVLAIAAILYGNSNFTGSPYEMGRSYDKSYAAPAAVTNLARYEDGGLDEEVMHELADTTLAVDDGVGVEQTDRLIIKTGTLSMVVESVHQAIGAIGTFAKNNGGFVVNSNVSEYGNTPSGHITIRIPSDIFDAGVGELKQIGDVKSEHISGQDVTEQFVDLGSQLKNLEATEAQLQSIMKRAGEIKDVLAVQRELTTVRAHIERIEGQRKYLSESAKLSTVTINLSTDPEALPVIDDDKWKPFGTFKEAARGLVDDLKAFGDVVIWVVVYIPIVLLWIVGMWVVYRIGKWVHVRLQRRD